MSATQTPTAEFIRLGYGEAGAMQFHVSLPSDFDLAAAIIAAGPPHYNEYDADAVLDALHSIWPMLCGAEFGREYSPVLRVTVPIWTHQANGSDEMSGEPIDERERRRTACEFLDAMGRCGASELSWRGMPEAGSVPEGWYAGAESIPDDVRVYSLRAWWD